jgi:hypothetical protein
MSLSEKQAPFSEPYALAGNPKGFRSKGPTAEAVKRALAHLGFLVWDPPYDQHWNVIVDEAAAAWKRKRGIIGQSSDDGSWGKGAHDIMRTAWYEKSGEQLPAFDEYSQELLQDEAKAHSGGKSPAEKVQAKIVEFCEQGLEHPGGWNYTQNRAVKVSVDPSGNVNSDCSGSVIQAYHYAKRQTDLDVPDPAKQSWSGYGNTSYYEDDHPRVSGSYRVGDLAHYDGHVCLCIKAGNWDSSDWWSFGSEPPSRRKLAYRSDFRYCCRPPLVG